MDRGVRSFQTPTPPPASLPPALLFPCPTHPGHLLTRALVLLLLQTLSATLLPVMVAMAAVLALRQDPEFMVQSPLSLICVRELGTAWRSINHLEHKSKGSTLAEPEVPANGELGRDQRGDRDIKERGSWSRLTEAFIIKEGPTFQLWQGGRRRLHEQ